MLNINNKQSLIEALYELIKAIELSPNMEQASIEFENETIEIPTRDYYKLGLSGWVNFTMKIRYFRPVEKKCLKQVKALHLKER